MPKFIVVSGGVISGIGKGVSGASLALLLKLRGEKTQMVKFDPYLNKTASLLSPYQHGEVYLCDDGSETDLDLGTYERIIGIEVSSKNICTSGCLYSEILEEEVMGKYMGQTVQIMPHMTDKILDKILKLGEESDILVVEIGGTVGDMESNVFFEAVRQLKQKVGERNFLLIHVAPILWINTIQEFKTKPLQNSVRDLQRLGLTPDMLVCRVDRPLPDKLLDKVSQMSGIPRDAVFDAPDVSTVYEVPITFYDRHIDDFIADRFHLKRNGVRIHHWRQLVEKYVKTDLPQVTVGIIGKYTSMQDAYLSLKEAIYHAGVENNVKINIKWIEADKLEEYTSLRGVNKFFDDVDAIIVPGGFDNRGVEGKIRAIQYVREKKIPFLGICLGLQTAVIEFARNVCNIQNANSVEFCKEAQVISPLIHYVKGLENIKKKGGTLRLGAYDCALTKGSLAATTYKKRAISERHRHRFEVNNDYVPALAAKGLVVSGVNPATGLVEIMELPKELHPHFICCQFHPEFKSRLGEAHPLFVSLIESAIKQKSSQPPIDKETLKIEA